MRPVNGSAIVLKMKTASFASPNSIVVPFLRRRRDALDEQVEQRVEPRFFVATPHATGIELVARDGRLERGGDGLGVELLALEVARHQRLVGLDDRVEELLAVLLHDVGHVVGNRLRPALAPARRIHVRAHVQEVDDAGELVLGADRQLDRDAAVGELRAQRSRGRGRSRRARGRAC